MAEKVLVAYASTYGSTQEVAEAVAEALRESGVTVDLQPMRAVHSLAGYCGVVLGAPLYILHWHKDALNFLARYKEILARPAPESMPVAVFALGPFHDVEEEWQEVRSELSKELAKFPWLKPSGVQVFGGKYDPKKLKFPWNLVPAMRQMPASDIRDWDAIRAWALSLRPVLLAPAGAND